MERLRKNDSTDRPLCESSESGTRVLPLVRSTRRATSRSTCTRSAADACGNLQDAISRLPNIVVQAEIAMKRLLMFLSVLSVSDLSDAGGALPCHYPGSPQHGRLSGWKAGFPNDSIAEFECDPGYQRVGPKSLICMSGEWSRGIPFCVRDLARGKPVRQAEPLAMDFNAGLLVDGNDTTCTKPANHWSVSLFEETRIMIVKLVLGADAAANTVSIRIGDQPLTGGENPGGDLCANLEIDLESEMTYYVKCDSRLSRGSFISVLVDPKNGPAPLCALEAYPTYAVSHEDACPQAYKDTFKDTFNGTCYEFHYTDPAPIGDARSICYRAEGRLIGNAPIDQQTLNYLKWRAEEIFRGASFWLDLNSTIAGTLVNNTDWTNVAGKGACYVLSARNGFSRSECESPNHVICAYSVVSCGRPRLPKAFDGWQGIDKLKTGRTLKNLRCSEGFYAETEEPLSCNSRGEITGAVHCRKFVCGTPPVVRGGFSRSTSNHTVEYKCNGGKFVKGDSRVVCDITTLKWGGAPTCQTFFEVFKDWFHVSEGSVQKFEDLPAAGQVAILAAVPAVIILVLFGIFYRVRTSRRCKGVKGAFRLESRGVLPAAINPETSAD